VVRNSALGGSKADQHAHGIDIGTNTMGNTVIENCTFNFMNDSITGVTNNRVMLIGNESANTNPGGKSVNLTGTGKMAYGGNFWDVVPTSLLVIGSN
jgi:hypothetical protein